MWMCKLIDRWVEDEERVRLAWVERHLRRCPRCQQQEQLSLTYHRLVRVAREAPLPFPRLEWNQIRNRLATAPPHMPAYRFGKRWALAGATAVLLAVGMLMFTPRFWNLPQQVPPSSSELIKERAERRLPILSDSPKPLLAPTQEKEKERGLEPPRLASTWLTPPSLEPTDRKSKRTDHAPRSTYSTPTTTPNQVATLPLTPIRLEGEEAEYLQITIRAEEDNVYSF